MNRTQSVKGRVKQLVVAGAGAALVGSIAVIGLSSGAGASTQRNQFETMNVTVAVFSPASASTNVHQYTVTLNPCDGTFTGSGGGYYGLSGAEYVTESVSGTYVGGSFTLNSTYDGTTYGSPYTYVVGPASIPLNNETESSASTYSSGSPAGVYSVWVTLSVSAVSSYATHGQYVSSMGGGSTAARSCIGMPIQSQP